MNPPAPFRASTAHSVFDEVEDRELEDKVWAERARMLCAHVPTVMAMAVCFAGALCWLLRDQVDEHKLWWWFGARTLVVMARIIQAYFYARAADHHKLIWYRSFVALAIIDGLLWGAAWWALVPVYRLDLTAITLTAILGVASLSAFILHADVIAMTWHIVPMILPNVVFSLNRQDNYGLFGALSLATFAVFLLLEGRRAQARLVELLTLRFVHERVLYEREDALALAQHHSEAKSRFLASMSHEMRTPLHGILGLTRLLRDDEIRPVAQRRLELLERSGEHLLTVINDVLDVSKIEAGHVHIEHSSFDLSALLDEVVGVSTVTANRKGLQLLVQSELPSPCAVEGDPMRVRQILHNLLGNAIKFTDHGRVTLKVQRVPDSQQMRFVVQDTGIGIPESELAHIFDAFHQVDNALDKRHGGTGLGLTISRQLCMAMGGDLRCTSQRGVGSVFECTLYLPAADEEALPSRRGASTERAMACISGVVLLVEDNPVNAMIAEAALRQFGVLVHVVDDGRKALDWLSDQRPDVILMDCQMPVMDGFEAARLIRDQELRLGQMRVPIVALTANVFPTERQRCMKAGMDGYLGKPFSREELYRVLTVHMPAQEPGADQAAQAA